MKIEYKNIQDIKPYHRNPRQHEHTIPQLKESIKKYGFKIPIIITKNNTIITGHARYQAVNQLQGTLNKYIKTITNKTKKEQLKKINNGQIPTIKATDLTKKETKELRIIDNKLTENSTWDIEKLNLEIKEIDNIIGFTQAELDQIIDDDTKIEFDNYTQEDLQETQNELQNHHNQLSQDKKQRKIKIICPHCQETILLDKNEIKHKYFT